MIGRGDASKAAEKLDWIPKYKMDEVVQMMVQAVAEAERERLGMEVAFG